MADTAEQLISSIKKHSNGRDEFDALRLHYSGEGNFIRQLITTDILQEKLHYKSKRVLSFNKFLDRMQKVFNIFRDEGEPMVNSTRVRELFRRV